MKKNTLSLAICSALTLGATSSEAVIINWLDGPGAGNTQLFAVGPGLTSASTINSTPFTTAFADQASEFRMISPFDGNVGGGGEKSPLTGVGDESWRFDNSTGLLTGTGTAFPGNPGTYSGSAGSAAPTANTNPTLDRGSSFKGQLFLFLAPTTTSLAGDAYGAASISFTSGDNFAIFFPTLEYQWGGAYFPLGINTGGVTFDCIGALSGNVQCAAEYTINAAMGDDPDNAGFDGWTAQWNYYGTMSAVPLPAAVWLFGSGLLGLLTIAARRRSKPGNG